ncbi:MAG: ATP-binding protein [Planctomycetota bacterium]|nr:ATP-binding protein [Planctomycetota bacterium]
MSETLRILVADDEPGMRMGVARALRDFTVSLPDVNVDVCFEVEQAETGEQTLEKVAARPPHILLLDYKLPGISGLEVLDRLQGHQGEILTIMITAYASLDTAVSAIKRGAYDFLAKPFTPEELKITIRKSAGRVILAQQARKLAQEKRQVRFQLISVLAHELKAPLAAVEGYLRIIRDRSVGSDEAAYCRMLERSLIRTEGMRKLIGDLLDMTRIESGLKRREFAEVNVGEIARAAIDTATPEAAPRGITIALDAEPPVTMKADRGELEIILNNLVSNAVKYNRDGGRARVTVRREDGAVVVAVSDTGIGMTKDDTARLFAEFVRLKTDKTRHILGSGLGLSIVRKLATLYGGDVSVVSEPDVGSTFTVVLREPVNPEAAP